MKDLKEINHFDLNDIMVHKPVFLIHLKYCKTLWLNTTRC